MSLLAEAAAAAGAVVDQRPNFFFMVGSAGSPAASTKGGGCAPAAAPVPRGRPRPPPTLPLLGLLLLPVLFLPLPLDKGLPGLASDAEWRRRGGCVGLGLPDSAAGGCCVTLSEEARMSLPLPLVLLVASAKSLSSPRLPVDEGAPLRTGLASRALGLALACAQRGERASTHRCSSASVLAHSLKRWPLSTFSTRRRRR